MKKFITDKYFYLGLGILSFFVIWFIISLCVPYQKMIFPSPIETLKETGYLLTRKYTYKCIGMTCLRMLAGFGIAFVLALLFGLLAGNYPSFGEFLRPFVTVMKAIPTAAVVFLFLVLAGFEMTPVFMVVLVAFPILYEAVSNGVRAIDTNVLRAAKIDSATFSQKIFKIEFPSIRGYLITGLLSSFSLSFKIAIMSEIISGNTGLGIGSAIMSSMQSDPTDMRVVFAYSFIAVVLMFFVSVLFDLAKKKARA